MDTEVEQHGAATETAPSPPVRSDRPDATIRAVTIWHALGAVACGIALWAALAPGAELPGVVRWGLIAFFLGATVAQVAAAVGVHRISRAGRTTSLVVNYLVFVVTAAAVLNNLGIFRGFSDFAGGFAQGTWLMLGGVVGAIWWWAGTRIAARAPSSGAARWLKRAGQVLVFLALAGLAVLAVIAWVGGLDAKAAGDAWNGDLGAGLRELGRRLVLPETLGALALAAGSLWAFRAMWRPAMAIRFGVPNHSTDALNGLLFLSPNLLGFIVFFAGPLLFSLVISFFNWDSLGQSRSFVGFSNYAEILALDFARTSAPGALAQDVLKPGYVDLWHLDWFGQHILIGARDRVFWLSIKNILTFLVLAVPLSVIPALILSTILNSKLPGMKAFRAIVFIPSVAGVIGVTLIWRDLYGATVGWINYLLTRAADILPFYDRAEPVQQPWLTDTTTALLSVVVVFAWMTFGFNTVLYLAGHQAIPGELYEAAELDGANAWRRFTRITIPQLRNTTFYVVATTSILAMQLFDIVWILTDPPGSPDNATQTPVLHLYSKGFQESKQGYASAVAWILFVLIMGLTIIQFQRQNEQAGVAK